MLILLLIFQTLSAVNLDFYLQKNKLGEVSVVNVVPFPKENRTHFYDPYPERQIDELNNWWEKLVENNWGCSSEYYQEKWPYMRYLFRLLTISYAYEMQELLHRQNIYLGNDESLCPLGYKELFSQCHAKSHDMNLFLKRSKIKISSIDREKLAVFKNSERQHFEKDVLNENISLDPLSRKLQFFCREHDCHNLSMVLPKLCQINQKFINEICSEEDLLYGVSEQSFMADIIKQSHAFKLINEDGKSAKCLDHFIRDFNWREKNYGENFSAMNELSIDLRKNNNRAGKLFLTGALKEFDENGILDFLYNPKEEKQQPIQTIKIAAKKETQSPLVFDQTFSGRAAFMRYTKKAEINYDYKIEEEQKEYARDRMNKISSKVVYFIIPEQLRYLKKHDEMGAIKSPIGISYLIFLINHHRTQDLENIKKIIGKSFYVIDDMSLISKPELIELRRDSLKGFRIVIIN